MISAEVGDEGIVSPSLSSSKVQHLVFKREGVEDIVTKHITTNSSPYKPLSLAVERLAYN